jgi:hypothetical protein
VAFAGKLFYKVAFPEELSINDNVPVGNIDFRQDDEREKTQACERGYKKQSPGVETSGL